MTKAWIWITLIASAVAGCDGTKRAKAVTRPTAQGVAAADEPQLVPASSLNAEREAPRIRVESLALDGEREVFVLRGARGNDRIAFLHGLCGHAKVYLESFQFAAAERGITVAPNGDVACPNPGRRSWSHQLDDIDRLIATSLLAAGAESEPRGVTLIGYSLGATRAEQLARANPARYDALVLIGGPNVPAPRGLDHLRAAAMVAGEKDRQNLMKQGVKAFRAAGIPSEFFELPGAAHGEMGPDSERVVARVLDWLDDPQATNR